MNSIFQLNRPKLWSRKQGC